MESPRRYAVSEDVIAPALLPPYPPYALKVAEGGEETFDLVEVVEGVLRSRPRKARKGELLRDSDLQFKIDWTDNLRERARLKILCESDARYRELQLALCRSSVLHFINLWCWIYDPERLSSERTIPFVTFEYQSEHILWIIERLLSKEDGLTEKSRKVGATWKYVAVAVWLCLFHQQVSVNFMSQIENDVDDHTPDSLLGKARYIVNHLPEWMRGGWIEREQGNDRHMLIRFPETDSMIQGLLSRGTAGRSGRATMVVADEWAFVEDSENVLKAINDLSPSKFFVSTANGTGNAQYRMRNDPAMNVARLHWSDHPLRDEKWAKLKRQAMTPVAWAAEHEIDYAGSLSGRVYPQFLSTPTIGSRWVHVQSGDIVTYDPHFDTDTGQDYGMADACAIVFAQVRPPPSEFRIHTPYTLVIFDEAEDTGETVDGWRYLLNSKGYHYRFHVGDQRTGNQRDSLGSTWIKNFRRPVTGRMQTKNFGVVDPGPPIQVTGRYNSEIAPIQSVQKLLQTPGALAVSSSCRRTIMAFQNWSYPTEFDPITGQEQRIPDSKPQHDSFSHIMKALAYLADYLFGSAGQHEKPQNTSWSYPTLKIARR